MRDHAMDQAAQKARREFEQNRDPLLNAQRSDLTKSEAERREDADRAERRASLMVKRQRPEPALKPSRALAHGPDRAAFEQSWTREQDGARHAALEEERIARREAFKALRQAHRSAVRGRDDQDF